MAEPVETVGDVGSDEESVAVDFLGVLGVKGLEVVGEEFWENSVRVWVVGWEEGTDDLGVVVEIGVRDVFGGDEGEG